MWLLFLVATIGMLALGLVVVNAGALFRLRYAFWILVVIISSRGFSRITADLRSSALIRG
jgi:hypothetical protein